VHHENACKEDDMKDSIQERVSSILPAEIPRAMKNVFSLRMTCAVETKKTVKYGRYKLSITEITLK